MVALFEPFYSSGGIDHFSLAGEEGMTFAAQLDAELLFSRTDCEGIAAGADHLGVRVKFGVYLLFHNSLLSSVNADLPFIISKGFKLDLAIDQGKNGVIFAETNIIPGMDFSTALTDNNCSGQYLFTCISFNP